MAAAVAPDGVARVDVLDDARASGPSIGIDATGATTAAWVRMTDTTEVRTAHLTSGAWEPPRVLGVRARETQGHSDRAGGRGVTVRPAPTAIIADELSLTATSSARPCFAVVG